MNNNNNKIVSNIFRNCGIINNGVLDIIPTDIINQIGDCRLELDCSIKKRRVMEEINDKFHSTRSFLEDYDVVTDTFINEWYMYGDIRNLSQNWGSM